MIKLALIFPCYNEEEVLLLSYSKIIACYEQLKEKQLISAESKIIFVDDGSRDKTWPMINELTDSDVRVSGIKLSRNFGHQNALLAGLSESKDKFDCYITLDVDLQDDINAVELMLKEYSAGCAIVYGVRSNRDNDSFFKKQTAQIFYKLMNILGVSTVYNHADYRLINNQALKEFLNFGEVNLFLRGIFPQVGFQTGIVEYKRMEREAGESKYPLKKMLSFAWQGITSFSAYPMKLILKLGVLTFFISLFLLIWVFIVFLSGKAIPGWSSMIIPIVFFGSIQMISIGLIGEYIGKIYIEVKARPRFIIEEKNNLT